MIVNFDQKIVDINGKDVLHEDGKVAEVRDIAIEALLATYKDEQNLSGEEKLKRYELAIAIKKGEKELKVDDITLIKKLVGKAFAALIVGQVWKVLEG